MKIIVNARVLDPANRFDGNANVFIENSVIAEVSARVPLSSDKVFDAKGLVVAPGFIDLHTHLREPGFEYKEDIESGSRAAKAGGFTTIFCMPNTKPANDNVETTKFILKRAREASLCHVLPVGAMTKGTAGKELTDFAELKRAGCAALSDDGACIQDAGLMREAMLLARKHGLLLMEHAEDIFRKDTRDAENKIIERDMALAKETRARIHITHLSTTEGLEMVRKAKGEGIPVTCDVTPHHLLLTEADLKKIGANAKMKPPLRNEADCMALIGGLKDGTVDAIATDHAPHSKEEKQDATTAQYGVIGLETAFPVCMNLVEEGRLTLEKLIALLTIGPAKVAGLKCGRLSKGAPADIVIFDPNASYIIDSSRFKSKSRNTPFEGWEVKGKFVAIFVAA